MTTWLQYAVCGASREMQVNNIRNNARQSCVILNNICVGIQAGTFDIKILNRLAGGFFIEQFEFWTPIIKTKRKDDKEKTMQHYDEFEDVVNRLKAMRKSNR